MYPHDISEKELVLPPGSRNSAVLLSGNAPRHLQFGYKLQRKFPGLLRKWWVRAPAASSTQSSRLRRISKALGISRKLAAVIARDGIVNTGRRSYSLTRQALRDRRFLQEQIEAEAKIFLGDLYELKETAQCHPTPIDDLNSDSLVDELENISPYFLFSLGGALLAPKIFKSACGLAINQHSGWSPEYKGSYTSHAALYNRDILHIGNTIHLLTTGADNGPILRRSSVKIHPGDTMHDVFMAAIALGTDLLLEVVEDALSEDCLPVYEQPHEGQTFLAQDLDFAKISRIERDIRTGWIKEALENEQRW